MRKPIKPKPTAHPLNTRSDRFTASRRIRLLTKIDS
jgi:hypothetical protein